MKNNENTNDKLEKIMGNIIIPILLVIILGLVITIMIMVFRKENYRSNFDNRNYNNSIDYKEEFDNEKIENNNKNYLSQEKVLNIVLKDMKLTKKDISNIEIELEKKYGQVVYEVDFDYKMHEYEYYVNAEKGNIVKSFKKMD